MVVKISDKIYHVVDVNNLDTVPYRTMYEQGKSVEKIAALCGVKPTSVTQWLKRHGVALRDNQAKRIARSVKDAQHNPAVRLLRRGEPRFIIPNYCPPEDRLGYKPPVKPDPPA